MNFDDKTRKKLTIWVAGIILLLMAAFLMMQNIGDVLSFIGRIVSVFMPLIIGVVMALILNVPMSLLERGILTKIAFPKKTSSKRGLAIFISFLIIFAIFAGIMLLIVPELVNALGVILSGIGKLPDMLSQLSAADLKRIPFGEYLMHLDWTGIVKNIQDWALNTGVVFADTAIMKVSSISSAVVKFTLGLVFSVYILYGKEKFKEQTCRLLRAWFPKRAAESAIHVGRLTNRVLKNFVAGQTMEALILGTLCMIGMFVLRIPYAMMVGVLTGVCAFIPVFGAFIGAAVGAFMILTISPLKAVEFLIFLVILQQIEGNLIYPKVMGSRVNLGSIWILVGVTIGGSLGGPIGMLAGVPVISIVYELVKEGTIYREKKQSLDSNKLGE